jgi:type IV secretion system protein VirB8
MRLLGNIKEIKGRLNAAPSKDVLQTTRNWFNDRYEWAQVQRNILFLLTIVCILSIAMLTAGISFIKSTRTIEPFVIEIEPKTGVPTVVIPKTSEALSEDEAIRKFYIWYYIRMREEYYFNSYVNMLRAVGTMSSEDVFGEYRREHSSSNPQSAYTLLGTDGVRTVDLKSMLMERLSKRDSKGGELVSYIVQVRLRANTKNGGNIDASDKYIRMECEFRNLDLSEDARLVNPLGFYVTKYQITDDKVSAQ